MSSIVKILTDLDCELWIDQIKISSISKGRIYKYTIDPGKYILELKYAGNTLKYYEYSIADGIEDLLMAKLTKKLTLNISDHLKLLYGLIVSEGDLIDSEAIETLISFDGENWEEFNYKHTFILPINYCGVCIKFNYGYTDYDSELNESTSIIRNTYQQTIFIEKYADYLNRTYLGKKIRKLIASLNPYDFSGFHEFEGRDSVIDINVSWLNVDKIHATFNRINNKWEVFEFGNDDLRNIHIDSSISSIVGIDFPFLLVSNNEKVSVYDINKNKLLFPYEYDEIFNDQYDCDGNINHFCFINKYGNFKIRKNNLIGISDINGNILIKPIYKNIYRTHIGFIGQTFGEKNSWLVLKNNESFDQIFSFHFSYPSGFIEKSYPDLGKTIFFIKDNQYGWWDINGIKSEIRVDEIEYSRAQFDHIPEEEFFYGKKNGKWGLISRIKGIIIPFIKDSTFSFRFECEKLVATNKWVIYYDSFDVCN